jgi:virulence factor Mce-like protein
MSRTRLVAATAVVLVGSLLGASGLLVGETFFGPRTISAYFTKASAIYPGDGVRVSGVEVGRVQSISPEGTDVKLTMTVDRTVPIPADAKAVIVAQNLISARYVQLAPAYRISGPVLADGAVIPIERTAVPVEWDEVKEQLNRLATDLGPSGDMSTSSMGRFIDSAAGALEGNGDKLRQTLAELSGVARILADGGGNVVETIKNLQTFVTALRDSNEQIVQFEGRLATLSSVLDNSKSELDAALVNLSQVLGEVQRFIAETRDKASEQVQRLSNVTQNLVDHRKDVEQILHIVPNAIANTYSFMDPQARAPAGTFVFNNLSDPVKFLCGAIGGLANVTSEETAKLCSQYLGPGLSQLNVNNVIPFPFSPLLTRIPPPEDLIYTDPKLAPGGAGPDPGPPETPPAVSAYTGAGDVAPPPGYGPPPGPPAAPPPGQAAPPADQPSTLQDMLLPAERPPS